MNRLVEIRYRRLDERPPPTHRRRSTVTSHPLAEIRHHWLEKWSPLA